MADIVNKDYPCSQKDLYSVLETAWGNNGVHLARFTAFKALYTLPFKTTALSAIASAKALPDDDARRLREGDRQPGLERDAGDVHPSPGRPLAGRPDHDRQ